MAICTECKAKVSFFDLIGSVCQNCRNKQDQRRETLLNGLSDRRNESALEDARVEAEIAAITLTTESTHGLEVSERLEIITAECVLGMNIFSDIASAVRDLVGGRNESYQAKLRDARKAVLKDLRLEAHRLGADAVVAVDLDYSEISGGGKSMLFLVASGTAVRLKAQHHDGL